MVKVLVHYRDEQGDRIEEKYYYCISDIPFKEYDENPWTISFLVILPDGEGTYEPWNELVSKFIETAYSV